MKNTKRIIKIMSLMVILFYGFKAKTQVSDSVTVKFDESAIGAIVINDSVVKGTGFVLLKSYVVVTCAHVVLGCTNISYISAVGKSYKLKLKKLDTGSDLALLISDEPIATTPLLLDKQFSVKLRQLIYYGGIDVRLSSRENFHLTFDALYVEAYGKVVSGGSMAEFIDFKGVGFPGFSGSPVFNEQGKVIAILCQGWREQDLRGGSPILKNRAFSIFPVLNFF